MIEYILAQVFFGFGFAVQIGSNFFKVSRKTILHCGIIFSLCTTISYVLLHAWTGALAGLIGCLMNIFYFYKDKNKFLSSPILPIIFMILYIGTGILSWEGWTSILLIVASIIYTLKQWVKEERIIKFIGIFVNSLYFIYDFIHLAYVAIIGDALSILMAIAYLIWGERYNKFISNLFRKK